MDRPRDYLPPLKKTAAAEYLTQRGYPMSGRTVSRLADAGAIRVMYTPAGFRCFTLTDLDEYIRDRKDREATQ